MRAVCLDGDESVHCPERASPNPAAPGRSIADVDSADEIATHIAALQECESTYLNYVDAGQRGDTPSHVELRKRLLNRSGRTQQALDASGIRFALTPGPMFGGPILTTLPEQLFAFERPAYGYHAVQLVLDALAAAEGRLEDKLVEARNKPQPTPETKASPEARPHHQSRFTLFGRIHAIPTAVAFLADAVVVAGAVWAIGKYAGLW